MPKPNIAKADGSGTAEKLIVAVSVVELKVNPPFGETTKLTRSPADTEMLLCEITPVGSPPFAMTPESITPLESLRSTNHAIPSPPFGSISANEKETSKAPSLGLSQLSTVRASLAGCIQIVSVGHTKAFRLKVKSTGAPVSFTPRLGIWKPGFHVPTSGSQKLGITLKRGKRSYVPSRVVPD